MSISRRNFCRMALLAGFAPPLLGRSTASLSAAQTPKKSPVLTLLHTNDPHGRIYLDEEAQGLTRVATLVRKVRQEMPNVLLLDAGDLIHGTPEERAFEGKPMIAAMNALQYDAATVGNHEFDFGQRVTRRALQAAQFPVLSANVLDEHTGLPWNRLQPYIMREVDGIRVAIFGLTTPDTVKIQFPRTLQGIRFADPITTARELVPMLRTRERADLVIFLSHLGYLPDKALAAAVPDIDIILGGHSHNRLPQQVWVNNTLIMQTGYHCRALGRVDVLLSREAAGRVHLDINGREGKWWGHNGISAPLGKKYPQQPLVDVTQNTPHDATVLAAYRPFHDRMQHWKAELLTTLAAPLTAENIQKEQTPLGRLIADAVRAKFSVDIALVPAGAIVRGLPGGAVRVSDAIATIGGYTRQHVVTARVSGRTLREFCVRAFAPGAHTAQISGIDLAKSTLDINGQLLRDNSMYTVAAAAYLIQGEFMGRENTEILTDDPEAPTTRDALVEFLRTQRKNPQNKGKLPEVIAHPSY